MDDACAQAGADYREKRKKGKAAAPSEPNGPTVKCSVCHQFEPVEYPIDDVAARMAVIRHLGKNPDCARAKLSTVGRRIPA